MNTSNDLNLNVNFISRNSKGIKRNILYETPFGLDLKTHQKNLKTYLL